MMPPNPVTADTRTDAEASGAWNRADHFRALRRRLLAAPAGTALRLTANPYRGLALSALIALLAMWVGLALADLIGTVPPGSAVILVAIACYCGVALWDGARVRVVRGVRSAAVDTIEG